MNKNKIMNKVVLVTGASSGFGKYTALELIKKGYTVYGAARRVAQMKDIQEAGGVALNMDVTSDESVKIGIETIIKQQGKIDVLVNNAGFGSYGFIETTNIDHMKRMYDVNVWGLVRVSQHVIPYMRKQNSGSIINVSSIVGEVSAGFLGFYASSKHAVEAISDAMRQEVKQFGINVSIVQPGVFSTGFDDVVLKELEEVETGKEYEKFYNNFIPYFKNMYEKAPSPEPVVNAIVDTIESAKPKTRKAVGKDAKTLKLVKNIISDKTFDKMLLSQIKMN
jgi:NADP-dependent 3-hydroxy acid dehydrogenase YdfG